VAKAGIVTGCRPRRPGLPALAGRPKGRTGKGRIGIYFWFFFGVIFACLLTQCSGWSVKPLVVDGMERIFVPYFQNDTFYRGLEERLTLEVLARVHERADLRLVDRGAADLILEGRVVDFEQRVLSENTDNRTLESSAIVTVQVKVVRVSDGQVMRQETLTDRAEFFRGLGETLETAEDESFKTLSHRIVSLVERGF